MYDDVRVGTRARRTIAETILLRCVTHHTCAGHAYQAPQNLVRLFPDFPGLRWLISREPSDAVWNRHLHIHGRALLLLYPAVT